MNISEIQLKLISYLLMFTFIIFIIPLHLFPCFIAGFLVYGTIMFLTSWLECVMSITYARWLIIICITALISITIIWGIVNLINFFTFDIHNYTDIISEIYRIFFNIRNHIPSFLDNFFPQNTEDLKNQLFSFIEVNLIMIHNMGKSFLHGLITIFIGLVLGIIVALNKPSCYSTYFTQQLIKRLYYLYQSFQNIVFAQIRVSLINTFLTSIIILLIFPLFNIVLPLRKTLIILTFIFGLLPIIGNLISNIIIIITSLSISFSIGSFMMLYLIFIHKLEYFLNAEIIGHHINAKSWELILVMLVFREIFGLEGLIAAPIYYAYLKTELRLMKLI